ncbi:MAG: sulfurtransferase-like selenium metabolism protein YedF [Spirochaetaceae bacterium]|nr:sulfurtransferase-like selenium metabolism protein YedF [Spirochaetaceae bacterium]MDT8297539.1 sulfurtransferase-like selenium metabolism protein YedF [Spirochaetaceae bacterium]
MTSAIVDARGMACPKPLIMTKKALKESPEGFAVLMDNATSRDNVRRFLDDNDIGYESTDDGGTYRVDVKGGRKADESELSHPDAAAYCEDTESPKQGFAVSFPSDRMGDAPEELQRILIEAFCSTLPDIRPYPESIVFYASGVHLVLDDSPVLAGLKRLEDEGVKMLICGKCLDYYRVTDRVSVGRISNMYDILSSLAGAGHVVTP